MSSCFGEYCVKDACAAHPRRVYCFPALTRPPGCAFGKKQCRYLHPSSAKEASLVLSQYTRMICSQSFRCTVPHCLKVHPMGRSVDVAISSPKLEAFAQLLFERTLQSSHHRLVALMRHPPSQQYVILIFKYAPLSTFPARFDCARWRRVARSGEEFAYYTTHVDASVEVEYVWPPTIPELIETNTEVDMRESLRSKTPRATKERDGGEPIWRAPTEAGPLSEIDAHVQRTKLNHRDATSVSEDTYQVFERERGTSERLVFTMRYAALPVAEWLLRSWRWRSDGSRAINGHHRLTLSPEYPIEIQVRLIKTSPDVPASEPKTRPAWIDAALREEAEPERRLLSTPHCVYLADANKWMKHVNPTDYPYIVAFVRDARLLFLDSIEERDLPMLSEMAETGKALLLQHAYRTESAESVVCFLHNPPSYAGLHFHFCFKDDERYVLGKRSRSHRNVDLEEIARRVQSSGPEETTAAE